MSDADSLAGFSRAGEADDQSIEGGGFAAAPRAPPGTAPPRARARSQASFRARPRAGRDPRVTPSLRARDGTEFAIRPPPDTLRASTPTGNPPRPDSTALVINSPPSTHRSAAFDTVLLRERIEAHQNQGSVSPHSGSTQSASSALFGGLTRVIENPSEFSVPSGLRPQGPAQFGARARGSAASGAKKPRLADVPEDQPAGGRLPPLDRQDDSQPDYEHGMDMDFGDSGYDDERAPSSIQFDPHNNNVPFDAHQAGPGDGTDDGRGSLDSENSEEPAPSQPDVEGYVRPRPREPGEPEPPLVFEVPVNVMPAIDWLASAIDVDGQVLAQRLEHSESESDSDESVGSLAEMIESDSETEAERDANGEWQPKQPEDAGVASDSSDSDGASSDAGSFGAATVSEGEDSDFTPEKELEVVEIGSRRERPKRHRIPTVKWWLGERIQYEVGGPLDTLTAVDVRRVEPEKKVYRRRRPYRRRRGPLLPDEDEDEDAAARQTVHAPVLDADGGRFRERTVARSINGLDFEPMRYADGSLMPMVSRCAIFGTTSDAPVRLYVVRVEPGAVYTYEADVNKVCTLVVWRGRCTAKMNRTEFELQKGMACLVPPANDLYVDNGGKTAGAELGLGEDVFFFATEINARDSPELAAAMTRDAQSVISGAASFSRLLQMDGGGDDLAEANSFVSGLQRLSQHQGPAARLGADLDSDFGAGADGGDDGGDDGGGDGGDDDGYDGNDGDGYNDDDDGEILPAAFNDDHEDDVVSVAPSIFLDLQNAVEAGNRRQPAPRQRQAQSLSFRLGRHASNPVVANDREQAAANDREQAAAPSFHLERGSKLPPLLNPPMAPVRTGGNQGRGLERRELTTQRQRAAPLRRAAPGNLESDQDLELFFAQINEGIDDPNEFQAQSTAPQALNQYMLDRVVLSVRPPTKTDSTKSA